MEQHVEGCVDFILPEITAGYYSERSATAETGFRLHAKTTKWNLEACAM